MVPVGAVAGVGTQADGEEPVQLPEIAVGGAREGRRGFRQGGVEGRLELRPLQGPEEAPAEGEGHQLRRREGEGRDAPEALQEFPDNTALHPLGEEREARGLEGLQVPAHGPEMLPVVRRQDLGELLQSGSPRRGLEVADQVPLADDLIIPRHDGPLRSFRAYPSRAA
jgi:hypothetical protein